MLAPLLAEEDRSVSAEGTTIDPLGTYAIADALAVRLVPGVRERQRHPRFLTAMAVSHIICDGEEDDAMSLDHIRAIPFNPHEERALRALRSVLTRARAVRARGSPIGC